MSSPNKLELESNLWNGFGTFGVTPARIPLIVRELMEAPPSPDHPGLDELTNAIFHQHSILDAAYFVFPYLIDIHARHGGMLLLAANIASSANLDRANLPPQIRQAFLDALSEFEAVAVRQALVERKSVREIYNASIAALAFSQNCCGRLLTDVLDAETDADSTNRTYLICPKCRIHIEVALFDEGAVVVEEGQKTTPPQSSKPFASPLLKYSEKHSNNSWNTIGSFLIQKSKHDGMSEVDRLHVNLAIGLCELGIGPNVPPEGIFSLIGAILLVHGFTGSARRFFRLWDTVTCSKCNCSFIAAKGWWGCT